MLTSSFGRLLGFRPHQGWTQHALGLLFVLLALSLTWITPDNDRLELSFLVFYLAVFLSSIIGGSKAGVSASLFSVVVILLSTIPQDRLGSDFFVRLGVFSLWSLSTGYIIGLTKNAYQISLSVLNNIHSFVAILSPSGRYIDVNQPALDILQVAKDEIITRHFLSKKIPLSFAPAQRKQLGSALKLARQGHTSRFDIKFTRDFRSHEFLDFSISPIFDRQQNVIYLVVSATSITSRIQAETKANRLNKSLQQKVSELQTLFEVLPVGIAISADSEGASVQANSALFKILGIEPVDPLPLASLIDDPQAPFHFVQAESRLKKKDLSFLLTKTRPRAVDQELTIVRSDQTKKNVFISSAPILEAENMVVGSVMTFVDLTERKKVEAALINSELRFKKLVDSNLIGVIVTNLNGEVLEANEAFASTIGYTQSEIQHGALNWKDITPKQFRAVDEIAVAQLRETGECIPYEKAFFRKDGSQWPVLIGAVMTERQTETFVALVLDISARQKLEKRKDEFIGLASHELKTPLTSIKVFTQLLGRSLSSSNDQQNLVYITKMNQQIDRLTSLVEDLLDVSKIESGKLQLNYEVFDFNQLVQDTIFEVQSISQSHTIQMSGAIEKPITADAYRLAQVVSNLLTNAIKYSPAAHQVDVALSETKTEIKLSVRDYGVGIPETELTRVFEKFFRARGKNRHSFPGLGLGLYLSSQIVRRHGGTISVESQEGNGSVFTVSLLKEKLR